MGLALVCGLIVCNLTLKPLVARIRPYDMRPIDNMLTEPMHDFSFPSGHTIASFEAAIVLLIRNKRFGIPATVLAAVISFSRLYLYVHYPTDVLFGAALGALFACLWEFIYQKHEKQKWYIFAGFALLSIIFTCIFHTNKGMVEICACTTAAAICLPLENKYICFEDAKGAKNRIFRALIGLGCVGAVYCLFSFLPFAFLELLPWKFVKYFLTVSVATLLVPYLFKKIKI